MVHIVNFSPVRRTPKHTDFHDDPISLFDVTVPRQSAAENLDFQGTLCRQRLIGASCCERGRGVPGFREWTFTRWSAFELS